MREGGRGWERVGEGGRGWERVGEGGRGWERVGESGRGWERVGEGGRGWEGFDIMNGRLFGLSRGIHGSCIHLASTVL